MCTELLLMADSRGEEACFLLEFYPTSVGCTTWNYCSWGLNSVYVLVVPDQLSLDEALESPSRAQQHLASYSCSPSTAKCSCWNGFCLGWTLCEMQREQRGWSNRQLNLQGVGLSQRGRATNLTPAWEGIRMGGCCAYWRSLCWRECVACETFLSESKNTVPLRTPWELKSGICCIRIFLMVVLIHLISYKGSTNQRWWHRKYKSLWYAWTKGVGYLCISVHAQEHSHLYPHVSEVLGERVWSSVLEDVSPSLDCRLYFSVR